MGVARALLRIHRRLGPTVVCLSRNFDRRTPVQWFQIPTVMLRFQYFSDKLRRICGCFPVRIARIRVALILLMTL